MLVLTRRQDESIRIGNDIIITVLSIDKGQVKLGMMLQRMSPLT
jgi:carbon storage regulator